MTTDRDSWLAGAFAPARQIEPTDLEVARALARATGARRGRSPFAPAGRTIAVALLSLLLAATAAGAATGLIPVGSIVRGDGFHDDGTAVKETVVATGSLPELGAWRMTTFRTEHGVHCLKLQLREPTGVPGPKRSGYCGWIAPFWEASLGGRAAAEKRGKAVLFGIAPAEATSVELRGGRGVRVTAETHGGADGQRYWALAAPIGLDDAQLSWADGAGDIGGGHDVSYRFTSPPGPVVVGAGKTSEGTRWRMTAHESERLVNDGDVYQPEGLPCLTLEIVGGWSRKSSFCGVQPKTPGFTRQQTATSGGGREPVPELILYGHAPERADAVEVRVGGRTLSAETIAGPDGVPGRFWLLSVPRPPADTEKGRVRWVDRDAGERGRPVGLFPL